MPILNTHFHQHHHVHPSTTIRRPADHHHTTAKLQRIRKSFPRRSLPTFPVFRRPYSSIENDGSIIDVVGDTFDQDDSMVAGFLDAISKVRQLSFNDDDDLYDRLSRRYTVVMLTLFAVIISTKQYVGDPIACWTPAQFTGAHVEYTNYICWISNKYYVDFRQRLPGRQEIREHKIAYYQWVPFILLTMMLFFYIPNTIWKFLSVHNGFDVASWVKLLNSMEAIHPVGRRKTIRHVASLIMRCLNTPAAANIHNESIREFQEITPAKSSSKSTAKNSSAPQNSRKTNPRGGVGAKGRYLISVN